MKIIRVPIVAYYETVFKDKFNYPPFFDNYNECARPAKTKYEAGDVVVIQEDGDEPVIGVVLGIIDNTTEELRTDARGMVSFDMIRHATKSDLTNIKLGKDILKFI